MALRWPRPWEGLCWISVIGCAVFDRKQFAPVAGAREMAAGRIEAGPALQATSPLLAVILWPTIDGDIEQIIATKRSDTAFLFFTDGLSWKQRKSDLRKIVEYQNAVDITQIYTYAMADRLETDLEQLKREVGLADGLEA